VENISAGSILVLCSEGVATCVEDVQEHRANVSRIGPVELLVVVAWVVGGSIAHLDLSARVIGLESVSATPNDESEHEQDNPQRLGANGTSEACEIQAVSEDHRAPDLREPVEDAVEGAGAGVEPGQVDAVEVVGVEPIGGEEHGEEEDHVGLVLERLPHADELGLPSWVLHDDDAAAVVAHHALRVAEEEGEDGAEGREDDEANVCAV